MLSELSDGGSTPSAFGMPGVSTTRIRRPWNTTSELTVSRVNPGMLPVMKRSFFSRVLSSVDLPLFGMPRMVSCRISSSRSCCSYGSYPTSIPTTGTFVSISYGCSVVARCAFSFSSNA